MSMRRREFLGLIGGAAAAWPVVARAQQVERVRRVGVVAGSSEGAMRPSLNALRGKLSELGWIVDRNLSLDVRLAAGNYERLTADVGALISANTDVIIAQGSPAVSIIRKQSSSIPVVFTQVADPVVLGIVQSLARPGGFSTGFTNYEFSVGEKWLDLLMQVYPQMKHVALIANPANENTVPFSETIEKAGKTHGIAVTRAAARDGAEIERAIVENSQQAGGGMIFFPDALPLNNRELIVRLAVRHQMPGIYPFRDFAANGGLISYGLNFPEVYRQAAVYVDRILKGEKVADLPVQAPTKFELVINVKTAKTLGLEVPSKLLFTADEVIE
jgi:putative ABC transport system substrate-binding protein